MDRALEYLLVMMSVVAIAISVTILIFNYLVLGIVGFFKDVWNWLF